jgi:hypothetical protein
MQCTGERCDLPRVLLLKKNWPTRSFKRKLEYSLNGGRAIAQAVSRSLPIAVALVRTQVRSCGICDGQCVTGAGFLRVLRFPLPILIAPTAPHSSSSVIRG